MSDKMQRVSRRNPCPVCERSRWCGVSADGSICVCMRVSDGAIKQTKNGGWLHRLKERYIPRRVRMREVTLTEPEMPSVDCARLAAGFAAAVDLGRLGEFANGLCLSTDSLTRLGVGWSNDRTAWAFPMRRGQQIVGIRLRSWTGHKWSVTGGREGLFIPHGLTFSEMLLIAEGPTDTAALLDMGFEAVGRPSCSGGVKLLVDLIRSRLVRDTVIVADVDSHGAGQRGAESLAVALAPYCPSVRVIAPPGGIKDVRDWRRAGAGHDDIMAVVEATPARRLVVRSKRIQPGGRRVNRG